MRSMSAWGHTHRIDTPSRHDRFAAKADVSSARHCMSRCDRFAAEAGTPITGRRDLPVVAAD
jgi:hypothetical protein